LASVSALGLGLPAASLQAACSNTSDSNIRFGVGNAINQCDSAGLAIWGDSYNKIITIDDSGIHPSELTIAQGSATDAHVFFVDLGTNTHSATQLPSSPMWNSGAFVGIQRNDRSSKKKIGNQVFDTGGITANPGATARQAIDSGGFMIADFGSNGDYVYSSYPDCIAADRAVPSPTNFDCTPAIIHVVDDQATLKTVQKALGPGATYLGTSYKGSVLRPVGDPDCAKLGSGDMLAPGRNNTACISARRFNFTKAPTGSKSKPLVNPTVTIDDIYGFDPTSFTLQAGSSVTFLNKSSNMLTHDVVIANARMVPGMANGADNVTNLNSGGLAPGQSWTTSFQYVANSTINFSSDVAEDQLFNIDPVGNVGADNAFTAGLVTVCPPGQFATVSFDQLRGTGRPCTSIAAAQDPSVLTPGTVKDF